MPVDEPLDLVGARRDELEPQAGVALAQLLDEVERLLRQPAGVDREDAHVRVDRVRHVDQRDVALLERGREREPLAEALERPLEQLPRLAALELDRQLAGLQVVDQVGAHAACLLGRAGRGRVDAGERAELVVGQAVANCGKLSSSRRPSSQPATRPPTTSSSRSVGTRRNTGRPIAGVAPERAAQVDVVGLVALAALVAHGGALEAEVADPVLGAGVRAAVEVEPQLGDVVAEPRLEPLDRAPRGGVFVSVTEKLQCGSPGAADRAGADRVDVEREAELREPRVRRASTASSATPVRTRFCCRVTRTSPPARSASSATASICVPLDEADVDRHADRAARRRAASPTPMWSCSTSGCGGQREVRQRAAEALLDLGAHPLRPDVVDHELQARLDARDAVAEVLLPGVEQRPQHRQRLVLADEDAEVAREARHGREAAADEHAEALARRRGSRRRARCS